MPTQKIIEGIRKYRAAAHRQHQPLFDSLKGGQKPEVLLITCSDSRIDPTLVTQTSPGDLFVLRNAGNLVPPYSAAGNGESGTIEFAVKALGVSHVVVCGHSECGAMAGVLDPDSVRELPAVAAWLGQAGPGKAPGNDPSLQDQVHFNVVTQLDNLRTHPAVVAAERQGRLLLHGWVYDFVSGGVTALDPETGNFLDMDETRQEPAVVEAQEVTS